MGTDGGADSLPSSNSQSNTICDQHSTNMCIEHKLGRMEGLTSDSQSNTIGDRRSTNMHVYRASVGTDRGADS